MSEGTDTRTAARAEREAYEPASGLRQAAILAGAGLKRQAPARIVVIGEFNSGKTSLVNALLGTSVLPASFVTHTAYPTVVGFAAKPTLSAETADRKRVSIAWNVIDAAPARDIRRLHVGMPLERLRTLRVVDTPGLGFGDECGDAQTLQVCRGADTVIWCTPAMQAWKASEQRAWLTVPKRLRERGILAATFTDAIGSETDINRLLARLHAEAGHYFREIVMVSAHGVLAPMPHGAHLDLKPDFFRPTVGVRTRASLATAELC